MRKICAASAMGLGLLTVFSAPASAMSVNGNLSDWGVTVSDYTGSTGSCGNVPSNCVGTNWGTLPSNGSTLAGGAKLLGTSRDNNTVEDGNDVSNNYGNAPQLSPFFGGQNFDAEFMGVAQQNGKLYVAIVSGQRPDNTFANFEPGDLKMVINSAGGSANGTYGIELGGGSGHSGSGTTAAITTTGGNGSTYNLKSNGTVNTVTSLSNQTIGSIWKGASFKSGVNGTTATQINQNSHGTSAGVVDAIYETQDTYGTLSGNLRQHSIIELQIDLEALLGSDDPAVWAAYTMDFTWGPSCGNDLVLSGVQLSSGDIPTPEPAALTVLLFGVGALARLRRRRAA
jgi:MYXO-CTERM domain-containing protein